MRTTAQQNAFSLVEISIVLVIIGLLVGGIVAGQSLLRSAQLRSVTADLNTYGAAVAQFQGEFNALPGDFARATDYWTSANGNGTTAACYAAVKTSEATCNGTGDGALGVVNPATSAADGTEQNLAWQHLADAGLITGSYTGTTTVAGAYGVSAGVNVPASKVPSGVFMLVTDGSCYSGDAFHFDGCYQDILFFGGQTNNYHPAVALLKSAEQYNLDRKVDDGQPGTGNMRTWKNLANCASSATAYNLSTNTPACEIMWGAVTPFSS